MSTDSRSKAKQQIVRIQHFREELIELEQERILTLSPDQRTRLDSHLENVLTRLGTQFDLDISESGKRISWGMRVVSLLGAASFFAALILFLHRIWGDLPTTLHVSILLGVPLLFLGVAELMFRRGIDLFHTNLVVISAGVAFVIALNALGSILNVAPAPQALLAWGGFTLFLAYAYGLRLPLAAGLLLLCAYTACLAVSISGVFWANFLERPESILPASLVIYAIPSFVRFRNSKDFASIYRLCGAGASLFALFLVSLHGQGSFVPVASDAVETVYQFLGLIFSAAVVFHAIRLGSNGLMNLGTGAFVVFIYVKLHVWWWEWMPKYLFFFLIGMMAIGLLLVFRQLRTHIPERRTA